MQDRIAGLATLQSFGRQAAERARLNRLNLRLRQSLQTRAGWRGHHRALSSLAGGALLSCLAAQAVLTSPGPGGAASAWLGLTAGSSLLVMLMLPAIRTLGQVADAWVSARVARARVAEFLANPVPPAGGSHPVAERPALVLRRPAWVGRVEGPEAVIPPGWRVAISGPPGAGKTSLLLLMAGLQTPSAGAVWLDDRALSELDPASLRRRVSLLSPDLPLLRGTVLDNLLAPGAPVADEALARALWLSGLAPLLPGLADGLQTRVRDAGLNLSHGQRKAIQLARCLVAQPAILLIDDPAACLPGNVEDRLRALLSGLGATVVFTTSDPALAAMADEHWALENGRQQVAARCHVHPVIADQPLQGWPLRKAVRCGP
jgi:ABC-type multidrug transport system fused ATPase/permease subunit